MAATTCVFCDILRGGRPASFVAREGGYAAFLDARPVFKGHVLVVPEQHTPDLFAMPEAGLGPWFSLVRRVAAAVEEGLGAKGAFVAVNNKVSQSVPHLHAHVVPRTSGDGLRGFFWPRTVYASDEERESYARRIAGALRAAPGSGQD